MKTKSILLLLIVVCITPSYAGLHDGDPCRCPQRTDGWLLYDDDNPSVPDFFLKDHVVIKEIFICDHGMHFFFPAKQDDQQFLASFVVVKPSVELFNSRASSRCCFPDPGAPAEQRVDKALAAYECCRSHVERLLGSAYAEHTFIEFPHAAPRLLISVPLELEWRGRGCAVSGYIDVYFSKIS